MRTSRAIQLRPSLRDDLAYGLRVVDNEFNNPANPTMIQSIASQRRLNFSLLQLFAVIITPLLLAGTSPLTWPEDRRLDAEIKESTLFPKEAKTVTSSEAMISATVSPLSIESGLQTLKSGGTAADAAIVVALTQVATCGGSVVSYAGITDIVYYESKSKSTYNLSGPWKSYREESDPESIPSAKDLTGDQGRKTFVPGFMAAIGELHDRFGVLPWDDLFEPAIHYTENGVSVSSLLANLIKMRESVLGRTADGRSFLQPNESPLPQKGEIFYQPETARTLRAIAKFGPSYMYEGDWAKSYVEKVRAAGGHASLEDLKNYEPIWQAPLETEFSGYTIKTSGPNIEGGHQLLLALNLATQLDLQNREPYWNSVDSFRSLTRVSDLAEMDSESLISHAASKGVILEPNKRYLKDYAIQVLDTTSSVLESTKREGSNHSDAIIVVDRHGNIAALTHTINTVIWGSTGIVVGGIPISDPASIYVVRNQYFSPGEYLSLGLSPAIAFKDEKPAFAISAIGAHRRETARIMLSVLGQQLSLPETIEAPRWPARIGSRKGSIALIEGEYSDDFIDELKSYHLNFTMVSEQRGRNLSGTAAFILFGEKGNIISSYTSPKYMTFSDGF